ncbi:hypothetical protein AOLI_G00323000 [Acnodon oligacanthus]
MTKARTQPLHTPTHTHMQHPDCSFPYGAALVHELCIHVPQISQPESGSHGKNQRANPGPLMAGGKSLGELIVALASYVNILGRVAWWSRQTRSADISRAKHQRP